MKQNIMAAAAVTALIGLTSAAGAADKAASVAPAAPATEKCYGVAKAGMNDCHAATHSCAGLSKKDGDKGEYITVPAGLCEKLVGGAGKPS